MARDPRLRLAAARGQLEEFINAEAVAIDRGSLRSVRETNEIVKVLVRAALNQAFTGSKITRSGNRRVANAIRGRVYDDRSRGRGITSFVYSRLGRGRGEGWVDYLIPHIIGQTIRPRERKWLMLPLKRRATVRRALSGDDKRIKRLPVDGGKAYLIGRQFKSGRFDALALQLPAVSLKKRVNIKAVEAKAGIVLLNRLRTNLEE